MPINDATLLDDGVFAAGRRENRRLGGSRLIELHSLLCIARGCACLKVARLLVLTNILLQAFVRPRCCSIAWHHRHWKSDSSTQWIIPHLEDTQEYQRQHRGNVFPASFGHGPVHAPAVPMTSLAMYNRNIYSQTHSASHTKNTSRRMR